MKTKVLTVLLTAVVFLTVTGLPCMAADEDTGDIWGDEHSRWGRQFSKERVDQYLKRLAESSPEKAAELEKLRKEDPEKFRAELRKVMIERYREYRRQREAQQGQGDAEHKRSEGRGGRGEGEHRRGEGESGRRSYRDGGHRESERERHEFLAWLKENYPEEAEKLEAMRDGEPDQYERRRRIVGRKYRRIYEASKENPALVEVLKKDMELRHKRFHLVRKIRAAEDEAAKKELTGQLESVVSQRFDLLIERKEIEYEQLQKKLEELKAAIEKSKAEVAKWHQPTYKDEKVATRVEELVSGKRRFRWE